jgi:hypothetical protein
MATSIQIVFDCANPDRVARFWAAALGYTLQDPPKGFASWEAFLEAQGVPRERWDAASAVVDPEGIRPRIFFQKVPEGKAQKNRVHLDLNVGGGHGTPMDERKRRIEAEIQRLIPLGAKKGRVVEENGEYWVNMLDVEGNEFDLQ